MSPPKHSGSPRRVRSHIGPRLNFLLFVEGQCTEELYVNYWRRQRGDGIHIRFDVFRGPPLQLVQHAVVARKERDYEEMHGRGRTYDQIWCVFDRDDHPNFERALNLAAENGIALAISNPCIELWFALHFQDQSAHLDRDRAQNIAERWLECGKNLTKSALRKLEGNFTIAKSRANYLDVWHGENGSPTGSNPSSSVWTLIDEIVSFRVHPR